MKGRSKRVIARVDELRLLANPTKLRIFEALRDAPASPHELARRFGLKPTALYRHFARLEQAKLIEVVEERQRRGAIERRFSSVAGHLVVDRALARSPRSVASVIAAASAILDVTAEDVRAASLDPSRPLGDRTRSEIGTFVVRVKPAHAKQLMRELRSLIATAQRYHGSGEQRVRLTLALLPVGAK